VKVLLDTHILLWWQQDRLRLGERARSIIASPEVAVLVSTASLWEIAIKYRLGKIEVCSSEALNHVRDEGFTIIGITADHTAEVEKLPHVEGHRDPFDHLLLAQAKVEGAALITADRILTRYGVRCLPA
jgi:PIN domain nuclease of toxin-antitoxin system